MPIICTRSMGFIYPGISSIGISWIACCILIWESHGWMRTRRSGVLSRGELPASVELATAGTVLSTVMGVYPGVKAAERANSPFDTTVQIFSFFWYVVPTFMVVPLYQVVMILLYQHNLPSLPVEGWGTLDTEIGPILLFALTEFAYFVKIPPNQYHGRVARGLCAYRSRQRAVGESDPAEACPAQYSPQRGKRLWPCSGGILDPRIKAN
jgi:hypothetical protein